MRQLATCATVRMSSAAIYITHSKIIMLRQLVIFIVVLIDALRDICQLVTSMTYVVNMYQSYCGTLDSCIKPLG